MKIFKAMIKTEKELKKIFENEIVIIALSLLLSLGLLGWYNKSQAREFLLSTGFFCLGFVLGSLWTTKQLKNIYNNIKEKSEMLIEDITDDLSRYAIVAGESYDKTKTLIAKYKKEFADFIENERKTR